MMAQTRKIQSERERDIPIEVLIGREYYWRIVKDASTIHLTSLLVLLPTTFGWILTGNRTGITANQTMVNYIILEHSDNELRNFVNLETIGNTPCQEKSLTAGDSRMLQEFSDSYHIHNGRTVICLPKKDICELS
jgi:hypothetical protein